MVALHAYTITLNGGKSSLLNSNLTCEPETIVVFVPVVVNLLFGLGSVNVVEFGKLEELYVILARYNALPAPEPP